MAAPSRPPTWKQYTGPNCTGCGRRLTYDESLFFQGYPFVAVWGFRCCALVNRSAKKEAA